MVNRDGSVCAPDVARVLDRGDAGDVRVVLYRDGVVVGVPGCVIVDCEGVYVFPFRLCVGGMCGICDVGVLASLRVSCV